MPSTGGQYSAWCFTINNPREAALHPEDHPKNWTGYKYLVYQLEKGHDTGTYHWQGYVYWLRKKALGGCKKVHGHAHWEPRRGTHEQAREYCTKEDTRVPGTDMENPYDPGPFEFGDPPEPGKRNDLLEIKALVDENAPEKDLWENHFGSMVRYSSGINKYRNIKITPRSYKTEVAVFYGPTGTGKTRYIRDTLPSDKCYWITKGRTGDPWMDGYDPVVHDHVVIDEFYGWIKWDMLLRMLDRYPLQLEIKGGMVQFKPKYIWITSNKSPAEWYKTGENGRDFATLLRRLNVIRRYTALGEYVTEREEFDAPQQHSEVESDQELESQEEIMFDY